MTHLLNHYAPNFTLPNLAGGRFSLVEGRGQVVVIAFWSADCPWSRRADVALVYRQLAWGPQGVQIVGIASNYTETEAQTRSEAQARHVQHPILIDRDQAVANLYQATVTPQFFVIDRQGLVRYGGGLDDATDRHQRPNVIYLDLAVSAVLANRQPDPAVTDLHGSPIARVTAPSSLAKTPPPPAP